jgi:hypothetical protein
MSRSRKKRPFAAYCGGSQKEDKRICNRLMRHTARVTLHVSLRDEEMELLFLRPDEALDKWSMSQDDTRHYAPYSRKANWMGWYGWYRWVVAK